MKTLRVIVVLVLLAVSLHAQGGIIRDILLSSGGRPVPNATIRICSTTGTPCPLATVYTDKTLSTTTSAIITTDANGNYGGVYVVPGYYTLQITAYGSTITQEIYVPGPSGGGGGGGGGGYSTVQSNGSNLPAQVNLNFSSEFTAANNAGLFRTDVSVNSIDAAKLSGTNTMSASVLPLDVTFRNLSSVRYADQYAGLDTAARVTAACASLGSGSGVVVIPSTLASGTLVLSSSRCLIEDQRNQNGYAYGAPSIAVKASRYLVERFPLSTTNTYTPFAIFAESWSGGINVLGSKANARAFIADLNAHTPAQSLAAVVTANCYSVGDCQSVTGVVQDYGFRSAGGDEGGVALRAALYHGGSGAAADVFTATVTSINSGGIGRVGYGSVTNEQNRGEGRWAINTNAAKVYSTGTVSSISGTPAVVTGSGTSWLTLGSGAVGNLLFELTCLTGVGGERHVVPILSIGSNTSLTLILGDQNVDKPWWSTECSSGSYKIYKGSYITDIGTNLLVVQDSSQFAVGDTIEIPLMPNWYGSAVFATMIQRFPSANLTSLYGGGNLATREIGAGLGLFGPFKKAMVFSGDLSQFGIHFAGKLSGPAIYIADTSVPSTKTGIRWERTTTAGSTDILFDQPNDRYKIGSGLYVGHDGRIGLIQTPQAGSSVYQQPIANSDYGWVVAYSASNFTGCGLTVQGAGIEHFSMCNQVAKFSNGTFLRGWSGNYSTQTWEIQSGSGGMWLAKLGFGGFTSSVPMLKASSTTLQARLGDDSAYANVDALGYKVGGNPLAFSNLAGGVTETPSGSINGSNSSFTLSHTPSSACSMNLYINGFRLTQGSGYTLSGATITYSAGYIPNTGDSHEATYCY